MGRAISMSEAIAIEVEVEVDVEATDAELLRSGLASQGRRGPVDRFRGRLLWPIRDLTGEVIAFGARKLAVEDDGPKYLNTPETPLFKKSSVLYGADLAKREIAHRRQAVIVEGYTDVMACHLAGLPTAVATCGTSFGDGHVKVLRRLLMDADQFRGEVFPVYGDVVRGWSTRADDFRGIAACSPYVYSSIDELFFALVNLCVGPRGDC